ncbi:MAG: phosphoesterase [Clostridiales bacterium GWF2_38_85]|nr:MAG: phosphoesterase [Clostridiales bacterium GWF2_38_85]HBL85120.1 phosphoesterase [Clostridiales bacterium]
MSQIKYLLPKEGEFYKTNLHAHTTVSDGAFTPEQMKSEYMKKGYSAIAYTDHNKLTDHNDLCDESFIAINGFECDIYESGKSDFASMRTYHLNFLDTDPKENTQAKIDSIWPRPAYDDMNGINAYIEKMNSLGFLTTYNHPYWSLQNFDDIKILKGIWAFEIYNHGCEVEGLNGYAPQTYDELLRLGNSMYCVMTDDNHNHNPLDSQYNDSFGGFTMIKAESLSYENIIKSMKEGNFYCSMSPQIHELYIEENTLVVKCDPVQSIFVTSSHRICHRCIAPAGETITSASYKLTGNEGYIRVTCKTTDGKFANSNAYFI